MITIGHFSHLSTNWRSLNLKTPIRQYEPMGEHKFWGHIVDPGCTKTMDTGSSKRCWVCETDVRCGWWGERKMERESKRWGRPLPVGWTHCNPSTEDVTVTQQPVCGYSVRLAWGSPPLPPTPTPPSAGERAAPFMWNQTAGRPTATRVHLLLQIPLSLHL